MIHTKGFTNGDLAGYYGRCLLLDTEENLPLLVDEVTTSNVVKGAVLKDRLWIPKKTTADKVKVFFPAPGYRTLSGKPVIVSYLAPRSRKKGIYGENIRVHSLPDVSGEHLGTGRGRLVDTRFPNATLTDTLFFPKFYSTNEALQQVQDFKSNGARLISPSLIIFKRSKSMYIGIRGATLPLNKNLDVELPKERGNLITELSEHGLKIV